MSGGTYDYGFRRLEELADNIRPNGDCHACSRPLREAFRAKLLSMAAAARAIEWNDSGDGASDEEALVRKALGPEACLEGVIHEAELILGMLHLEINRARGTDKAKP